MNYLIIYYHYLIKFEINKIIHYKNSIILNWIKYYEFNTNLRINSIKQIIKNI